MILVLCFPCAISFTRSLLFALSVFRFLSPNLPLCFLSNTHDSFNIVNYPTSLSLSLSLSPNNPKRLFSIKLPPRNVSFLISFSPRPPLLSSSSPLLLRFDCHSDRKLTPPPPKRFVLHSHLPHFSTTLVLQFSHRSHFPISSKSIPIPLINFPPLKFNLFFFFPRFQIQIQENKQKTHIDILVFFFVSML